MQWTSGFYLRLNKTLRLLTAFSSRLRFAPLAALYDEINCASVNLYYGLEGCSGRPAPRPMADLSDGIFRLSCIIFQRNLLLSAQTVGGSSCWKTSSVVNRIDA